MHMEVTQDMALRELLQGMNKKMIELDYARISWEDKNKFLETFMDLVKSDVTLFEHKHKKEVEGRALLSMQLKNEKELTKDLNKKKRINICH